MAHTISDLIVETLKQAGVGRVYGLPGDSLNGFTDALRRDGTVSWEHVRHEEVAAFAAAGEAAVTGELAGSPAQFPHVLEIAVRSAVELRGVAVLVVPGDVLVQAAGDVGPAAVIRPTR